MRGDKIYKELKVIADKVNNSYDEVVSRYNISAREFNQLNANNESLVQELSQALMGSIDSLSAKEVPANIRPILARLSDLNQARLKWIPILDSNLSSAHEKSKLQKAELKKIDDDFESNNQGLNVSEKNVEAELYENEEHASLWNEAENAYQALKQVSAEIKKAKPEIESRLDRMNSDPFFSYLKGISWNTENYNRFWFSRFVDEKLANLVSYKENKAIYDNLMEMTPYLDQRLKNAESRVDAAQNQKAALLTKALNADETCVKYRSVIKKLKAASKSLNAEIKSNDNEILSLNSQISTIKSYEDADSVQFFKLVTGMVGKDLDSLNAIVESSKTTKDDKILMNLIAGLSKSKVLRKQLEKLQKEVQESKEKAEKHASFVKSFHSKGYSKNSYSFRRMNSEDVIGLAVSAATIHSLFNSLGTPTDTSYTPSSSSSSSSSYGGFGGGGSSSGGGFGGGGFGGGGSFGGGGFSTGGGF